MLNANRQLHARHAAIGVPGRLRNVRAPARCNVSHVLQQEELLQTAEKAVLQPPFRIGFKAEQGLREGMEDSLHVEWDPHHQFLFAGCYDGHGGSAAALWLRNNLLPTVKRLIQEHKDGLKSHNKHIPKAMQTAFKSADEELLSHLEELGGENLAQAGSTATIMMLWPDRVVVANVGDSQAYLSRNGQAMSLTTPHRVYGPGPEVHEEVSRVRSTGGWVYDGRVCNVLAVSRAFGDWEFKGKGLPRLLQGGVERGYWPASFISNIQFTSDPVIVEPDHNDTDITEDDEFLVVSTDGLWDVMEPRDVMNRARKELSKGAEPQQVAENLVQLALKRHTTDNTSVVVIDLKGSEFWKGKAQRTAAGGGGGLFGWLRK